MRKQVADLQKVPHGQTVKNLTNQEQDYLNQLNLNIHAIQRNMAITAECMQRYERKANGFMKRALQTATRATGQGAQP